MNPCNMCGTSTKMIVNIKAKAKPICNSCASSIARQHLNWLVDNQTEKSKGDCKKGTS